MSASCVQGTILTSVHIHISSLNAHSSMKELLKLFSFTRGNFGIEVKMTSPSSYEIEITFLNIN